MKILSKINPKYFFFLFLAIFAISCGNNKFKIKGEITGGPDKPVVLEKANFNGEWVAVDSTHTNGNGAFSFAFMASNYPEIYRISSDGRYIYIPVDSTETITVNTTFDNFGRDFSLDGSNHARLMEKFEKELQNANTSNSDSLQNFKRRVFSNYMKDDRGSILSFYILTKQIDGKPLYNPADSIDRKYFGAVATGFKSLRPDDPRTALLEETTMQSLKDRNKNLGKVRAIEAAQTGIIDIELPDVKGNITKLSDIAGKGKPVVVIFSILNHTDSPEFNRELAKIYTRLNGSVEFYNVSLDSDPHDWRDAAINLPWISVYATGGAGAQEVMKYNVFEIPAFFIYNKDGDLISRPATIEELDKAL